jgi:hypothetical protein
VPQRIIGWREHVALPALGLDVIEAKIDTGARTSTLHATRIEGFQRAGRAWVRFVADHDADGSRGLPIEAPLLDRRRVRSSTGHATRRPVIETVLEIAGERTTIELTLTDRSRMRYPLLIGRAAIAGRFLVDPGQTERLTDHPAEEPTGNQ